MLNALIALGILGTILLLMFACNSAYRILMPRGSDRAVERLQAWTAPVEMKQFEIVRKESLSNIPWLNDLLLKAKQLQPLQVLHR